MCLFRKKKVTYKKYQSGSADPKIAKNFFTRLDEEKQKSKEKWSQAEHGKSSLGRDFYSIFNDTKDVHQELIISLFAEGKTPDK